MRTQNIKRLWVLLGAQMALVVGIYWTQIRPQANEAEPMLALTQGDFDRWTVTEAGKPPVTISQKDGQWCVAERWNVPASKEKLAQTLDKVLALKKTWPVGDTSSALKRAKVTDDLYEKKIDFLKGDNVVKTLYFGTSPEYRKVNLRPSDRKEIYLAEIGFHDFSANPSDWEDKHQLNIDRNIVAEIMTPALHLVNKEGTFIRASESARPTTAPNEPGEDKKPLQDSAVDSLVMEMTNLNYAELLGPENKPEYGLDHPTVTVTIKKIDGKTDTYIFARAKGGDKTPANEDIFLKTTTSPFFYRLTKTSLRSLFPK